MAFNNPFARNLTSTPAPNATAIVEIDGQPRHFPAGGPRETLEKLMASDTHVESDFRKEDLSFVEYLGVKLAREHGRVGLASKAVKRGCLAAR
ncbi:hypothetical protein [Rhodoblastus sp.]|uniref:hypothetical protein n=1 Tax=Rhodoblastus sp. TaxID=1962975 RepID=UPI0026076E05|nr:hypothetical protein [Rhodoblastus sp.]